MMKKTMYVWIALLLLACLLSACSKNTPPESSGSNTNSEEQTTEITSPPEFDPWKPDVDLSQLDYGEQDVRILQCEYKQDEFYSADSINGAVVSSAVYKRNRQVEHDLNINFRYPTVANNGGEIAPLRTAVQQSVMAGDANTMYHIVANPSYYATSLITAGLYADFGEIKENYINLEKKYWSQSYVDASILNKRYYFVVGELCTTVLDYLEVVYVNNTLVNNYYSDLNLDVFQMVYDQEWTYEKMLELIAMAGEGESTGTYGLAMPITSISIDGFLSSFELDILDRYESGVPYVTIDSSHNFDIITELRKLYYENTSVTTSNAFEKFRDGNAIFSIQRMNSAPGFYNAGIDYSTIPFPKWNAEQQDYIVISHDEYTTLSICFNLKESDKTMMTAVLEDMCYVSHSTTYPAVYEATYQVRYNDSPENAEMFDYLYQHLTFSMGKVYSYVLGEAFNTPRYLLYPDSNTWVANRTYPIQSTLTALADKVNTKLEDLLEYLY